MNIPVSDIEAAIYGAEQVLVKNSGWITPNRFSHAQLRSFEKKPDVEMDFGREHFLSRTVATAGVTLDFVTDSISLSFEYRIFSASNSVMCYFDVFVNDHLYCHTGKAGQSWAAGTVSLQLPEGKKRVTVYFPCLHKGEIRNLNIDTGAQFVPALAGKEHQKILFLGDSITQGFTTAYPSLAYSNILTRAMHAECLNQAVGGDIFDEAKLDVTPLFVPDMVLVAYGTNDWYWRRDIEASALAYYRKLTQIYPEAKILPCCPYGVAIRKGWSCWGDVLSWNIGP